MGAGAVGGYFGAVLHRAGHEVTFVARGRHLEAIRRNGLRVESVTSGDFTAKAPAADRLDGEWTADLALFCVKGYDNPEAIAAMRPAVGADTAVLTLQNGVGSGDELAAAFGRDKVLLGVTYIDATLKAAGVVAETGSQCNIVFGQADAPESPRARPIFDALSAAGIDVRLSSDIAREVWEKLMYISALSGMTCITRVPFAAVLDTPETLALTRAVLREVKAVAGAKGTGLDDDVVETTMASFQEHKASLTSSMFTDLERGNRLEVGVLNGAVAKYGRELGVATPVNEFITACLTVSHNRAAAGRQPGQSG